MTKLVSIIVNCFNGEMYLKQCLKSIQNQSYKNWEVIFWDNQSTDQSKKIFLSFREDKFRYFRSSEFTNLSKARNLAISQAKGDYISFLDVDDFWIENKLETQVNFLERNKASLIYSNYFVYHETSQKKKIYYKNKFPDKNIFQELLKDWHVGLLTILYDKHRVKNMYFNEKYHFIGDMDFVMNNSTECKVIGQNEILAFMRLHKNNETKKNFLKHSFELLHWYRIHKKIYKDEKNIYYIKNWAYYNLAKIFVEKKKFKKVFKLLLFLNFRSKTKIIVMCFLVLILRKNYLEIR